MGNKTSPKQTKKRRKERKHEGKRLRKQKETPWCHNDDIEKSWWMTCWLDRSLRLYRAPIASRLTTIAGSHESASNILVLSSAYDLPLRIGESLDYLAMKAFASASMMSPSGRNNELPPAIGNELIEIHSDCSAKTNILGISAVFSVRDCSYSYAGGMIVDDRILIFNYGEFVAAVSAMLVAISQGYRDIIISTDSESLVKVWNGEDASTPGENIDRQLLALRDIVQSQGYSVRIQHVKGHGIDFRNTMADGLAEMGYSRPVGMDDALMAFDYTELRAAYHETIRLNEQLEARLAEAETSRTQFMSVSDSDSDSEGSGQMAHGDSLDGTSVASYEGTSGDTLPRSMSPSTDGESSSPSDTLLTEASLLSKTDASEEPQDQLHRSRPSSELRPHSLSISQPTADVCLLLNGKYDNVNINRVDRLVASGAIEKWENLSDNQANLRYARNLVSASSVTSDNQRIDAIWNALAKNVARKITNKYSSQKKRSLLVMRTMLVARLCGVPIEPSIDYVLSQQQSQ